MNECLTTPQHKNKSAIGCQTNVILAREESVDVSCVLYDLFLHKFSNDTTHGDIL